MIARPVAVLALVVALAACGSRADRSTAEELLVRPQQAAPTRNVELRTRSEEREDDPFDLPPPDQ